MRSTLLRVSVLAAALSAASTVAAAQTAQRVSVVETSAKVKSVNQETREVQLRSANGRELAVVAGPEVRNLPQLQAGDVVRLSYYESVAASVADPNVACANKKQAYLSSLSDAMPSAQKHEYTGEIEGSFQRCMAGEANPWRPIQNKVPITQQQMPSEPAAGGPATTKTVVSPAPEGEKPGLVTATTVDMVVEFVSYDAATDGVTFKTADGVTNSLRINPAMREFVAARKPGDRVAVEINKAMAVSIVE